MLYTYYNLILCATSLLYHRLVPYAFINSMAIVTSFHFPLLVDATAYQKVLDWNDVSPMVFWVGDIVIHFIPCLIGVLLFPPGKEKEIRIVHGLATGTAHVSWALLNHQTIILNDAYIEISDLLWICTWFVAFATHLGIPLLYILIRRNSEKEKEDEKKKQKEKEKRCVTFELNDSKNC